MWEINRTSANWERHTSQPASQTYTNAKTANREQGREQEISSKPRQYAISLL